MPSQGEQSKNTRPQRILHYGTVDCKISHLGLREIRGNMSGLNSRTVNSLAVIGSHAAKKSLCGAYDTPLLVS